MPKPDIILDGEEQALLDEIEQGEWIDTPLTDTEKQAYAQNAAYTKSLNEKGKWAKVADEMKGTMSTETLAYLEQCSQEVRSGFALGC